MSSRSALLRTLRATTTFEGAAEGVLHSVAEALTALAPLSLRLGMGLVHRRTAQGYDGLASVSWDEEAPARALRLGHSASAWTRVQAARGAVLIDVAARTATPLGGGAVARLGDAQALSGETVLRYAAVTHVLALPVRGLDQEIGAVISLEWIQDGLEPPTPDDWRQLQAAASATLDLAWPWLLQRPVTVPPHPLSDVNLPVVGAALTPRLATLEGLARYGDTLLLRGPPGSGKTCLARWIHARSAQRDGPFVTLHLQNVPEDLLPGELFGWRKGAHSLATTDRKGVLETARRGILFLDEIGTLSLASQARLLELLDTGMFRPLGDDRPARPADVRFLLATNEDLEAAMRSGRFRSDLYERISGASFQLPPLSERADEIPGWAQIMVQERFRELGVSGALHDDVLPLLQARPWAGNLRELRQTLRNAVALAVAESGSTVEPRHLQAKPAPRPAPAPATLGRALRQLGQALHRAAEQAQAQGDPLRLDDLDVLRAYTLQAAEEAHGAKGALELFTGHRLVETRNYNHTLARELARREAFEARLGELSCSEDESLRIPETKTTP